jgi:hypothetical protein
MNNKTYNAVSYASKNYKCGCAARRRQESGCAQAISPSSSRATNCPRRLALLARDKYTCNPSITGGRHAFFSLFLSFPGKIFLFLYRF